MRRRFIVWVAIAAMLLAGSSVLGTVMTAVIKPREVDYNRMYSPRPAPRTAQVRSDLISPQPMAFQAAKVADTNDMNTFQPVFDGLASAQTSRNIWSLQQHFDFERMSEELANIGVYKVLGKQPTGQSIADDSQTLQTAVNGLMNREETPFAFDRTQVVRVARGTNGMEALVLARHFTRMDGGERVIYRRWWLKQVLGQGGWGNWRVYDFDEPGTRMRFTVVHAGVLAGNGAMTPATPGNNAPPPVFLNTTNGVLLISGQDDAGVLAVRAALTAAVEGDRPGVVTQINEARRWQMLMSLAAIRDVAYGRLALIDRKPVDALRWFDMALSKWADTPAAQLGKAVALNDLRKYPEALVAAEAYRVACGNDPEVFREVARAKAGVGKVKEAVESLRAGVKEFPGSVALLAEWYKVSSVEQRQEVGELAAGAPNPGEVLPKLLRKIEADDSTGSGAAAVVAGYRTIRPREPVGLVADAGVKLRQRSAAAAATLLREGLAGVDDEAARGRVVQEFARTAVRVGRAVEAYTAATQAGHAAAAFRPLAEAGLIASSGSSATAKASADALRQVITAHAANHPSDAWPHYYTATLLRGVGDHAAAEQQLADGIKKLPPPEPRTTRLYPPPTAADADVEPRERDWARFRSARADSLFHLGQWKRAYDELSPKVDTFDELAKLFLTAKDMNNLEALLSAHRAVLPGDSELFVNTVEMHWLQKDYAKLAAACADYQQKNPSVDLDIKQLDRWVRSLIRLNKPREAEQVIEGILGSDTATQTLHTLIAAASGDIEETKMKLNHLYHGLRQPIDKIYADADLGPLLRSEAMSAVRKDFPPPATK